MDPLDRLAQALSVDPATPAETGAVLSVARDVAHTLERRITPVSTFLLGISVQERIAAGASRQDALSAALTDLRSVLPVEPSGGPSDPEG